MNRRRGLLHINLNVASLASSIRFYCEALGFAHVETTHEKADLGDGPELITQAILTIPSSHTILALTQADSMVVDPGGLNHLGLILENDAERDQILTKIEPLGGTIGKVGTREAQGVSEAFAYVRDPDGYAIELSTQAILYLKMTGL